MNASVVAYLIIVPLFVGIDMLWLLGPGRPIYLTEIGSLMRPSPNLTAAGAFYLIYCLGLVIFAVNAGLQSNSVLSAAAFGALMGFVAYATYDLTNLSVMQGFTVKIALIDLLWGTILSALVAAATTKIVAIAT